jgi:hypothetical protein
MHSSPFYLLIVLLPFFAFLRDLVWKSGSGHDN